MRNFYRIGIAAIMSLGVITVTETTAGAVTGFCGAGYYASQGFAYGGFAYCDDLAQGPPGVLGEWVRVKASCSNAPSVFYFGPKVYNDGQRSNVYPPCPPGTYVQVVGTVTGTG